MEGEIGTGTRIAVGLMLISVVITTVFVILGFTRGITNNGLSSVQNSMDQLSLTEFENYDQAIVSGTQVKSAVGLYSGRQIAVVIRTTAAGGAGYNYGATLEGMVVSDKKIPAGAFTKASGASWYTINYKDNPITYNLDTKPMGQTGTEPYVRPTAKFLAELIKDSTGSIVGICFSQQ